VLTGPPGQGIVGPRAVTGGRRTLRMRLRPRSPGSLHSGRSSRRFILE
jgi:hypothetical protein